MISYWSVVVYNAFGRTSGPEMGSTGSKLCDRYDVSKEYGGGSGNRPRIVLPSLFGDRNPKTSIGPW